MFIIFILQNMKRCNLQHPTPQIYIVDSTVNEAVLKVSLHLQNTGISSRDEIKDSYL